MMGMELQPGEKLKSRNSKVRSVWNQKKSANGGCWSLASTVSTELSLTTSPSADVPVIVNV